MDLFNHKNYHFIGIGGIGISAIARMLRLKDKAVTGSDGSNSIITNDLEKIGIKIFIGQKAENIPKDVEIVIHTIAIKEDNPELIEARKRNITILTYPEALGKISKKMFTLAISGTHGKTTVTAMIGHIMEKLGLDPTVIVGSKMLSDNSNFHEGKSRYLVVEACEYKRSFLNLYPKILVINNIEEDHLDYYKDIEDICEAFRELANRVPGDGFIIANPEDKYLKKVLIGVKAQIIDYTKISSSIKLLTPGKHNILNGQAAISAVKVLNIDEEKATEMLIDFKGTWRRLEYKGEKNNKIFYDDYAHHPTEISASLKALKEKYPERKIVAVFEPHQYSRTKALFRDFVESLQIADYVFIAPIFLSRENRDPTISNKILAAAVSQFTKAASIENVEELKSKVEELNDEKVCIVIMGAGDIYKWTDRLLSN